MKCPNCKVHELVPFNIKGFEVNTCSVCCGFLLGKNELEGIKDKIPYDAWFNIDLWDEEEKIKTKQSDKPCPDCHALLSSLDWNDSHIVIDMCHTCGVIWLDHGEFKKVIQYIKDKSDSDILDRYWGTLEDQIEDIVTGPKHVADEIRDILTVLHMFEYKFVVQHPKLSEMLINLPRV